MWLSLLLAHPADAAIPLGSRCLTRQFVADPTATPIGALPSPLAFYAGGRPADAGFVDSKIYPIRVHYRREQDAGKAETVVLPIAEESWQIQVDQMGWPAPPGDDGVGGSDAYDYYLTNDGTYGGAYTFGFGPDVTAGDDWYSVPSYIALDESLGAYAMPTFVSHEFNHALQYTIDAVERRVFPWESTAETMADLTFDDDDLYYYEVVDFNEFPFLSLVMDGYSQAVYAYDDYSYYEYGGIEWGMYLEEVWGTNDGATLLQVWDELAQPTNVSQPDYLDGLASIDDPGLLYTDFAVYRMFTGSDDDGAHLEESGDWNDRTIVPAEAVIGLDALRAGWSAEPMYDPYDLGTVYYEIAIDEDTTEIVHVEVEGDAGTRWGIAWAVWPTGGGAATTGTAFAEDGDPLSADIPLAGGAKAKFGVVDAGPAGMDGTVSVPRRTFVVSGEMLEDVPTTPTEPGTTGDTGTPPTTDTEDGGGGDTPAPADDDKGCGCASGGAPAGLLWLPALLALRRRR